MALHSAAYERKRMRLIAREVVGPDVLDIGYASPPNPHLRAFRTVGLDRRTPREPSGYAEEIQCDAKDMALPLAGRRFNSIVLGEFIEHLEAPYAFLRGLHPFLADGGRVILSTPNPLGFPVLLCEILRLKRFYREPGHHYMFLPRWMERMLNLTGFVLEAIRSVGLQLVFVVPPCPKFLSYQ